LGEISFTLPRIQVMWIEVYGLYVVADEMTEVPLAVISLIV